MYLNSRIVLPEHAHFELLGADNSTVISVFRKQEECA